MAKALTKKAIDALKHGDQRREVGDGGSAGLRLLLQPAPSTAKSWVFRYRSPVDGRPKKYTIGPLEAYSLAEAREAAGDLRRAVGKGIDPGEEKRAAKAKARDISRDVDKLLDLFIARHAEAKRASTAKLMKQQIEADIRPAWGKRKIETIGRGDVNVLLDRIVARGARVSANRVFSTLRKFLNWCVERGVIDDSPIRGMSRPMEEAPRARILSDDELRWLWKATADGSAFSVCVRLLVLTGQRRMEVGGMRWSELQLGGKQPVWTIPANRTKNGREHMVPLPKAAADLIETLPRIEKSDLVFTTDGERVSSGWSKNKRALDAAVAAAAVEDEGRAVSVERWTLHDLRRTCASGLAKLRQPPHVIEAVLNHKTGQVSGIAAVYNVYGYEEEKRRALAAWAGYVADVVAGRQRGKVISMGAR